jgi:two-component system response regulator YesN
VYGAIIIDDEQWIISLLLDIVPWREMGIQVLACARNGEEGLAACRILHPDIVLVDIRMPVRDGLELISQLRRSGSEVEAILVSGYAEFDYAKRAIELGVAGYITKPIDEDELVAVLEQAKLRIRERRRMEKEREAFALDWNRIKHQLEDNTNLCCHAEIKDRRIRRLVSYIDEHYTADLSLGQAAEIACMGATYLSEMFKREVGVSYSCYLTRVRLARAKELLERTNLRVGEIATLSGYHDANYFSRVFKEQTGMKPSEFRNRPQEPRAESPPPPIVSH